MNRILKGNRQDTIVDIIRRHEIKSQGEIIVYLKEAGFDVTQATVSRDIRELKLEKAAGKNGSRYVYQGNFTIDQEKYIRILKDAMKSIIAAGNMIIIKTFAGMAMASAAAIDELNPETILGTIAGDDTIMCACETPEIAASTVEDIKEMLKNIKKL